MNARRSDVLDIGRYTGRVSADMASSEILAQLADVPSLLAARNSRLLSRRDDIVSLARLEASGIAHDVAIKSFSRQSAFKDRADRRRGSSAERSWTTATVLTERRVGTPLPVAFLDRWSGSRLSESYFITLYDERLTSFRNELVRLYRDDPICEKLMNLLQVVADGVRRLHDAGVWHRDMGNQNILLRRTDEAAWDDVQFIDLNRARVRSDALAYRERAFDMSRIYLPSDFLRIFKEMYFNGPPPMEFEKIENRLRKKFAFHSRTRKLRHPIRSRKRERDAEPSITYPPLKDIWIWDHRSGQPVSTMRRKERKKLYPRANQVRIARACGALPHVYGLHRRLLAACYSQPVDMTCRVGMAVEPSPETIERKVELLSDLGDIPIIVRFYHHRDERQLEFSIQLLRRLHENGHAVSAALVQDRRAVLDGDSWRAFTHRVVSGIQDIADWIEVTHAFNRVKWGVRTFDELRCLMEAVVPLREKYPHLKWMGPAAIDFEYHHLAAALRHVPEGLRFDALSHLLYVDRRGAPENKQWLFSALEKFSLARAIAKHSPACEDQLIVSEVNWPLKDGGIHSPIGSPYLYPGQQLASPPSVTEDDYADYMIRYLVQALCSGMVERVYWWRLIGRGFGLVDDSDARAWRKRPAYEALRHFLSMLGDSTFERMLPASEGTHLLEFTRSNGEHVALGYSFAGTRHISVPFAYDELVDRAGASPAANGPVVTLTGSPVYFRQVRHARGTAPSHRPRPNKQRQD